MEYNTLTFLLCLFLYIQAYTKTYETIDISANDDVTKITMPVVFGDDMVLQREMPVLIFGVVATVASVNVPFIGQEKTSVSEDDKGLTKAQVELNGGEHALGVVKLNTQNL